MNAVPAYEREPYRTQIDAHVVRTGEEDGRPYAVLDDTVLYPEGGGQPADHGTLGDRAVLDVQKRDGEIRHFLDGPLEPGPAKVKVDWARRFDHMQQHTGQHLLTAVAQDAFGWETTAFHLGAEVCDIELACPLIAPADLEQLEERAAAEIRAARHVRFRRVGPEDFHLLKVRSRGLPDDHRGDIRLVEISGLDLNTCGGTHLQSTSEVEVLKLLGVESLRGGTRVFFVAGGRARRRLGAHERRNAGLRTLLGAPDGELVATVQARLDQLRQAERRIRALEEEVAAVQVGQLASQAGWLAERHFEDRDAAFLQRLARGLAAAAPAKALFLTATAEGQSSFVLAAGADQTLDLAPLCREAAALLEGRGGGSGRFFQGRAGSLAARDEVVRLLQNARPS
jgi:alanyl-tRNA synthetase